MTAAKIGGCRKRSSYYQVPDKMILSKLVFTENMVTTYQLDIGVQIGGVLELEEVCEAF